ncbi:hypothetical protein H4219_004636 [Mycoemilia scoparia]|uniref:Uncharacterized protein n=1 Tax=Mycoemilia scoparia TaxID=417184 RepID=A0A9W7ZQZ8_9FUNG|nr:hypothetical protein H4219_004636 [Mycoemilia scoparia]
MTNNSVKDLDAILFSSSSAPLDWAEDGLPPNASVMSPVLQSKQSEPARGSRVVSKDTPKPSVPKATPIHKKTLPQRTNMKPISSNSSPLNKRLDRGRASSQSQQAPPNEKYPGKGLGILGTSPHAKDNNSASLPQARGRSVSYSRGPPRAVGAVNQRTPTRYQKSHNSSAQTHSNKRHNIPRADAVDKWKHDRFSPERSDIKETRDAAKSKVQGIGISSRLKSKAGALNSTAHENPTRKPRTVSMSSGLRRNIQNVGSRNAVTSQIAGQNQKPQEITIVSNASPPSHSYKKDAIPPHKKLGIKSTPTTISKTQDTETPPKNHTDAGTTDIADANQPTSAKPGQLPVSPTMLSLSERVPTIRRHSIASRVLSTIDQLHFGQQAKTASNSPKPQETPKPAQIEEEVEESVSQDIDPHQEWEREWEEFCNNGGLERPLEELSDDNLRHEAHVSKGRGLNINTKHWSVDSSSVYPHSGPVNDSASKSASGLSLNSTCSSGSNMGTLVLENYTTSRPLAGNGLTIAEKAALCSQKHMDDGYTSTSSLNASYNMHDPIRGRHLFSTTLAVSKSHSATIHVYLNDDIGILAHELDNRWGSMPGRYEALRLFLEHQRASVLQMEPWFQ